MSKTISDVKLMGHKVVAGKKVLARAIIGNGQLGGWTMLIGATRIAGGNEPADVVLGTAEELVGKHLEVSAAILDVREQTDRLSLVVEVWNEGEDARTRGKIASEGDPGDSAAYSLFCVFS